MKLGMLVHHHDPECHVERLGSYLQGQGYSAGWNTRNNNCFFHISELLLMFLTFCNQCWHSVVTRRAGVLCGKFWIVVLKVKVTVRAFRSPGNICPNIFWTIYFLVMKLGMSVYRHDPECRANSLGSYLQGQGYSAGSHFLLLSSRSRSQC